MTITSVEFQGCECGIVKVQRASVLKPRRPVGWRRSRVFVAFRLRWHNAIVTKTLPVSIAVHLWLNVTSWLESSLLAGVVSRCVSL
jgi:hypothetical protein